MLPFYTQLSKTTIGALWCSLEMMNGLIIKKKKERDKLP